jgi:hypothetical protein
MSAISSDAPRRPATRLWWRSRSAVGPAALALAGCLIAAWTTFTNAAVGDYVTQGAVGGDNPAPAIDALIHGQFAKVAAEQPLMGLVSIVLRAPFAAAAAIFGGGNLTAYHLGALVCLLPAALLAAFVAAKRGSRSGWLAAAVVAAVILAGPSTRDALAGGHPEELLAGVLMTAAVLAGLHGRPTWAGALLGLAIGTKQWAFIGLLPVLVALPAGRMRALLVASALAGLMCLAAPLANPTAYRVQAHVVGGTHLANAVSVWWPASSPLTSPVVGRVAPVQELPLGLTRSGAGLLLFGLTAIASAIWFARAAGRRIVDPLALLALLTLVRCSFDPLPLMYYYAPLLIALGVWEVYTVRRAPIVTLIATALVANTFALASRLSPDALSAFSLVWTAGLVIYLARCAWWPARDPGWPARDPWWPARDSRLRTLA